MYTLPKLPYSTDALMPFLSPESFEYHYGKHHKAYVDTTNQLIAGTPDESLSLEDLVKKAQGKLFNNAAQAWNHTFFWHSMQPKKEGPSGKLAEAIQSAFGSFDGFKKAFADAGVAQFGSGWVWLVKDAGGKLKVTTTGNANTPLTEGLTPVLVADVWEHAYYIDHRNARPKFLDAFTDHIAWNFVAENFASERPVSMSKLMKA